MVHELAQASNKEFVSHETLFHLTDAALSAVASDPSLITADIGKPWLKELITSVTLTVGDQGIRRTFSKEGLEAIINGSLQAFADHPELIIKQSGLLRELVGGTLQKVSALSSLNAEMIASAAVEGALEAVADNPALLDTKYAELAADFAGKMATLVAAKQITGIQAADIATAAAQAITLNPILFLETENRVNAMVVDAVFSVAADSDKKLLAGATLVAVVEELVDTLARYGRSLVGEGPVEALGPKLAETLGAGVARAETEIGRGLDLPSLPSVLAELVIKVARGELTNLDPEDQKFQQLFAELAEIASA
jgi:hypothetical protein